MEMRNRNLHGKNNFAEVSKNLGGYRSENNFVRTNKIIVGSLSIMSVAKNFDILTILSDLHNNYFDISTKLFFLYLTEVLNTSTKLFFPCKMCIRILFYIK